MSYDHKLELVMQLHVRAAKPFKLKVIKSTKKKNKSGLILQALWVFESSAHIEEICVSKQSITQNEIGRSY